MPYFLVEDFKAGLDVRKSILTAPAGTLTRLVNAAITPGGEIEKRRAFKKVANLAGTFGLAAIGNKVVAFTRDVQTPNPGLKDPVTNAVPKDVVLEYHRIPNTSPTARLSDFDVFDGKLYVVLYDPSPSPVPAGSSATLPEAIKDGTVYRVTPSNAEWVWKSTNWSRWEAAASGQTNPDRAMAGDTFYNTTDKKIYVRTQGNTWAEWQPDKTVTTLPDGIKLNTLWRSTQTNKDYIWNGTLWVMFKPDAFVTTKTYVQNDWVDYNSNIFRAIGPVPAGTFDATKWEYIGRSSSVRASNPHYYMDDREKINDRLEKDVNDKWEWSTKPNPNYGTYQQTEGAGMGLFVRSYKSKIYAVGDKYLRFSAVDNAHIWEAATDPNDTSRTGAGYINVSLQEGASSQLRGVEIYFDKLALLSEYTTQIWSVTSDPKQAALGQVLRATGTRSPWSVQQFGSGDILFLANSGIRSLKARDLSNSASVSDIGSPIDEYVRNLPKKYIHTKMKQAADADGIVDEIDLHGIESAEDRFYYNARSCLEPIVGRFWLAFPREIMILSAFPGPRITAWSVYTTDFDIDYIVVAGDRVFIRSGDDLYLYGGVTNEEYDNTRVEVRLPYHDGGKPGHFKSYMAVDMTAQGSWDVAISTNYDKPNDEELVARVVPNEPANPISSSTWNKGKFEVASYASHLSLRFYNTAPERAILSSCAIHYSIAGDAD